MRQTRGVLVLFAAACSATEPSGDPVSGDGLFPFAVGSEWTYSVADSGQTAVIKDSVLTIRIVEESVSNRIHWYRSDPGGKLGTYAGFNWFANKADGVHHSLGPAASFGGIAWRYPASPGVVYDVPVFGSIRVASIDSVITVPAGTFHCLAYEVFLQLNSPQPSRVVFVAPGVGLIKDVWNTHYGAGTVVVGTRVHILTSFKP